MNRKKIQAILALAALGLWLAAAVYDPYKGYSEAEQRIQIPPGSQLFLIAQILESQGVVWSARIFQIYVRLRYSSRPLKAGEYRFERPLSLAAVAAKLERGDVYYHRVTLREGLTLEQTIAELVAKGFGEQRDFLDVTGHGELISEIDPQAPNLEGYLFPDTYFVTGTANEAEIIQTMVNNFRKTWTSKRQQRARDLGLTTREVVTLASLIEKETRVAEERHLVSAVFHNRLHKNMKLACDPTVIYAIKQLRSFDGIINQSDLRLDSPYNTYLYPGLPPGPIANPGLYSLDAALYPAQVDYLYFVSKNDGTHFFSTHYRDHSRAVRQYQR